MSARAVLYSSPYIPAEWISAHGLIPRRIEPSAPEVPEPRDVRAGMCPFMTAFTSQILNKGGREGLVFATTCDQFRRAFDQLSEADASRAFLMNVPATWQGGTARGMYEDEVVRLGRFLEGLGGRRPSADVLRASLLRRDRRDARGRSGGHPDGRVPVAVVGGAMTREQHNLFVWIGELGGHVALDGTEGGARTRPLPVDRQAVLDNPFDAMVEAYWRIPDVFRRPNAPFYDWLTRETRGIRGVIVVRQVWCDLWHAEVARIRDALAIPVLDLEWHDDRLSNRLRLRLEAFMEVIR